MEILPFIKMLIGTTSRKFIAPRREQRKENNYFSQPWRASREVPLFRFRKPNSSENFKHVWLDSLPVHVLARHLAHYCYSVAPNRLISSIISLERPFGISPCRAFSACTILHMVSTTSGLASVVT